jgi:flagellar M-ring protein FliF
MNEWFKKILEQIKNLWSKWSTTQKIILFSIIGVSILAIILLIVFSSAPTLHPLFRTAIQNDEELFRITTRLDEEGIYYEVKDNMIYVKDEKTAMRMRNILVREDMVPDHIDPWDLFDVERWSLTDFERNINLRRSLERKLEQHILALNDVDAVSVSLDIPDEATFQEDEKPITVSAVITPAPGSDITENRRKIEGLEKLIKFAVAGLQLEDIFITDKMSGLHLNDFSSMAPFDDLALTDRQLKMKRDLEQKTKAEIFDSLKDIFTKDRVRISKLEIDLDMSKVKTETEEYFPITTTPDNPKTPYDESERVESITLQKLTHKERFEGTGFTPEGPPGQEGQTTPEYQDLSNLVGKYEKDVEEIYEAVSKKKEDIENRPWDINMISIGVAIDGIWKWKYDDTGEVMLNPDGSIKREYIPVTEEELRNAKALIEAGLGVKKERGDTVTVVHMKFDRSAQHKAEDEVFRSQIQLYRIILWSIIGVGLILLSIIVFRLISRYLEKRRRLKEEELARQHQAMREAALRSAEEKGVEVELSVEERARLEMQENAINMAREHPEDVAQLIRTWLLEE